MQNRILQLCLIVLILMASKTSVLANNNSYNYFPASSSKVILPNENLYGNQNYLPVSANLSALPRNYELHFISGYEPQNTSSKIVIDRPGKNVVLVLTSYDKIIWELSSTPGTNIVQIISSANRNGTFIKTSKKIPLYLTNLNYSYSPDNVNFLYSLNILNKLLGVTKVDSFYGKYSIDPYIKVSSISENPKYSLNYPTIQKSPANISFNLMSPNGMTTWTASGPTNLSKRTVYPPESWVISNNGNFKFEIGNNALNIKSLANNSVITYPIPANFPEFSWPEGIAYCPEQNMVAITSLGGEGFFYRFNFTNKKWIDARSQGNMDYQSLIYDPYTKHFLAFGEHGMSGNIIELSLTGLPIKKYNLYNKLEGYSRLYDSGNGPAPGLSMVPVSNYIVILAFKSQSNYFRSQSASEISYIWVMNRLTGTSVLTYKNK